MRVAREFGAYNPKRYNRPWIAKVVAWPVGDRAVLEWGTYLGNHDGGEAEIEAEPGDVIRYGQKDARNHRGDASWAIVTATGYEVCTEAQAAKAFRQL